MHVQPDALDDADKLMTLHLRIPDERVRRFEDVQVRTAQANEFHRDPDLADADRRIVHVDDLDHLARGGDRSFHGTFLSLPTFEYRRRDQACCMLAYQQAVSAR